MSWHYFSLAEPLASFFLESMLTLTIGLSHAVLSTTALAALLLGAGRGQSAAAAVFAGAALALVQLSFDANLYWLPEQHSAVAVAANAALLMAAILVLWKILLSWAQSSGAWRAAVVPVLFGAALIRAVVPWINLVLPTQVAVGYFSLEEAAVVPISAWSAVWSWTSVLTDASYTLLPNIYMLGIDPRQNLYEWLCTGLQYVASALVALGAVSFAVESARRCLYPAASARPGKSSLRKHISTNV